MSLVSQLVTGPSSALGAAGARTDTSLAGQFSGLLSGAGRSGAGEAEAPGPGQPLVASADLGCTGRFRALDALVDRMADRTSQMSGYQKLYSQIGRRMDALNKRLDSVPAAQAGLIRTEIGELRREAALVKGQARDLLMQIARDHAATLPHVEFLAIHADPCVAYGINPNETASLAGRADGLMQSAQHSYALMNQR